VPTSYAESFWSWLTASAAEYGRSNSRFTVCVPPRSQLDHRAVDAVRMGEHLEAVFAGNRHQRHAGSLGHAYGKRGRRRDRNDDGRADGGGFLHHLDRNAAGQQHHALFCARALARKPSGKLVERVMTPDVLAYGNEAVASIVKTSAMHGAGLAVQLCKGNRSRLPS
jgi:hypothetical protein